MNNRIDFKEYIPTLTRLEHALTIYNEIMQLNPNENVITIDLDGMISMTTQCAKTIFGKLYIELGSSTYFSNIRFENMSDDLDMIIGMGIENAISTQK